MGNELLIGFTPFFLENSHCDFRWLGEILYGKESGEHKCQLEGIRTRALSFTARMLLPLKLDIPPVSLFPYPIEGYSNYTPSKIAPLCVMVAHFLVMAHYPIAYVRGKSSIEGQHGNLSTVGSLELGPSPILQGCWRRQGNNGRNSGRRYQPWE